MRAFARRGLCKPCKKYYDDSKGLEVHESGMVIINIYIYILFFYFFFPVILYEIN